MILVSALAGCAGSDAPTDITIDVIPQNHSGQNYKLRVRVLDDDRSLVDRNFTLTASDHVGKAVKVTFLSGTHSVRANAERDAAGTKKLLDHEETTTFRSSAKSLTVTIGTDEAPTFAVKD